MSSQSRIQVTGLKELTREIRKAGDKTLLEDLKDANRQSAKLVESAARPRVPVRSGKLVASLRSSGTLRAGVIRLGKANVPYAGPIHFGWPAHGIHPQPFLYEALESKAHEVEALYKDRIERLAERLNNSGS